VRVRDDEESSNQHVSTVRETRELYQIHIFKALFPIPIFGCFREVDGRTCSYHVTDDLSSKLASLVE